MATMGTISAALKLIDVKKQNLRRAFDDLQSQSSSLTSFPLNWSDLDSYFSSFQSSLQHKFNLLQSLDTQQSQQQQHSITKLSGPNPEAVPSKVPARPELRSLCERMDGFGLRVYITENRRSMKELRPELPDAYSYAPDAAAMVFDALEGFYDGEGAELNAKRNAFCNLLEELMGVKPEITAELREKAMKLAVEWKGKVELDNPLWTLGFLHLVAAYDLVHGFNIEELMDYVVSVAKRRQAIYLSRAIISPDRITDLIRKLISQNEQLVAVKFSFEFGMTDLFPPVTLLKEYRKETKKLAKKFIKGRKNSLQAHNDAIMKEVSALRSIIKCIEDYHLESKYPKEPLVHIVEKLEKEKASKKRPAAAVLNTGKRLQTATQAGPTRLPKSDVNAIPLQLSHPQTAGLLPDHPAPYSSFQAAGPYGGVGAASAVPYTGSAASPYRLTGAPLGFNINPAPSGSTWYPTELHTPASYYDRPVAYGGHGLPPPYLPSYYPQ